LRAYRSAHHSIWPFRAATCWRARQASCS
jgi:hypothetical protein